MSEQRLNTLVDLLKSRGWNFLDYEDGTNIMFPSFSFDTNSECIKWRIFRNPNILRLELLISSINEYGLFSSNLNEIFQCCLWYNGKPTEVCFSFSKINSRTWKIDLINFLNALDSYEKEKINE